MKLHPGLSMLPAGLDYVGRGLTSSPALALLAASGAAVLLRRDRLAAALPIGLAVGWFGYLALVGGDFFVGGRLLLPGFAALAVLARAGLAAVPPKLVPLAVIAAVAVELGAAHLGDDVRRARGETWPLHGLSIGRSLRSAFAPDEDAATAVGTESVADPVHRRAVEASSHRTPRTDGARSTDATRAAGPLPRILVDAAGAVPFASRLPSIDMLGLCDRRTERDVAGIEHTPRSAFVAAHRRSTPDHLFALDPDLALFGSPPGIPIPADEAGIALLDDERFADRFHCVRWAADGAEGHEGRELVANLWVRVDGRAGVRREDGEVVVPARLFGSLTVPRGFRLEPPDEPAQRIAWQQEVERGIAWARDPVVARSRGAEFRAEGRYEFELKGLEHGTWSAVLVPGTTPLRVVAVEPSGDRDLREPRTLVGDVRLALVVPARERMPIHLVAVALRRHP